MSKRALSIAIALILINSHRSYSYQKTLATARSFRTLHRFARKFRAHKMINDLGQGFEGERRTGRGAKSCWACCRVLRCSRTRRMPTEKIHRAGRGEGGGRNTGYAMLAPPYPCPLQCMAPSSSRHPIGRP